MSADPKIRLYLDHGLSPDVILTLNADQAHYLGSVMRQKPGSHIRVFNGRDGEWVARVNELSRKSGLLVATTQRRPQLAVSRTWVLMTPLKKARFDFAIEKATELGAGHITPVFTANTDPNRVNADRLRAIAREASEQCERLDCPIIDDALDLSKVLQAWPDDTLLFFADETGSGESLGNILKDLDKPEANHAFLIGPEGGFSVNELEKLKNLPFSLPVGLGPRILRAETAVCAVLSVYQAIAGDGGSRPLSNIE